MLLLIIRATFVLVAAGLAVRLARVTGDSFHWSLSFGGVLAAWLASGAALPDAITAANAAGALSVGAAGARAGMPSREEIVGLLDPS